MPPTTIASNPQEQTFNINEKGNELLLSVIPLPDKEDAGTTMTLDEAGLHQVLLSSEHILLHLDDPAAVESARELGQQLKHLLPMSSNVYSKAMVWMIYHCRGALAHHQQEWTLAIHAWQTCLAIDLPTTADSLLLQKVKLMQAHTSSMLEQCQQQQQRQRRSSIVSDASSSSSSSSDSALLMMVECSVCTVKKRAMPVCAQCKSQRYCGIKCLKLDKDRHAPYCLQR